MQSLWNTMKIQNRDEDFVWNKSRCVQMCSGHKSTIWKIRSNWNKSWNPQASPKMEIDNDQ